MISVIIPTLNEAERLPLLLDGLTREATPHEVIVVDGGSSDATREIASARQATVVLSVPGRGQQLATGVEAARGDTLLFLHADSAFPAGGLAHIEAALTERPDCPGGNFRLIFSGDSSFSHWLTGFYAWLRRRGFYYGDSAVFVRRAVYDRIGGIRAIALMEDYDFNRRLERAGPTHCITEPPLVTSSRRFEERSAPAIVWGWLEIHALYHLGVAPGWLAKRYEAQRRAARPHSMQNKPA